jgi:hypothetical protein
MKRVALAGVVAALAAMACGDLLQEPDTGIGKEVVRLEKVSGDRQVGAPGTTLAEPLRVEVVDFDGDPAPRLRVQWAVVSGSGDVEPRNAFSDAEGIAEATWILGPSGGTQQVRAFLHKGQPVVFEAIAE